MYQVAGSGLTRRQDMRKTEHFKCTLFDILVISGFVRSNHNLSDNAVALVDHLQSFRIMRKVVVLTCSTGFATGWFSFPPLDDSFI